jgi:ribosomal protein L22
MRFRPGPQGRAMPFAKRLSHLTIKVREREEDEGEGAGSGKKKKGARKTKKPAQKAAAPKKARKEAADAVHTETESPKRKGKKEQAS